LVPVKPSVLEGPDFVEPFALELLKVNVFMNEILRSRQTFKHKKISDTLRLNHKLTVDN
jgi:hypothetical protein